VRIRTRIIIGRAIEISFFVVLLAISYLTITKMLASRQAAIHRRMVIEQEEILLGDLVDLGVGAYGYALSGRQERLSHLQRDMKTSDNDLKTLESLVVEDYAGQSSEIIELENEYNEWVQSDLNPLISIRQEIENGVQPSQLAFEFVRSVDMDEKIDRLHTHLSKMITEEQSLFHGPQSRTVLLAERTKNLLFFGGIVGILLCLLDTSFTIWKLVRRFEFVVKYAEKVAGGDYSARIGFVEQNELGVLKESLNVMVKTLTAQISSLKTLSRKLAAKNLELEDFAKTATHDLQEPLRKIQIFANVLMNPDQLCWKNLNPLERIISSANRMRALISANLLFSSLTEDQNAFQRVDLNDTLSETLKKLDGFIRETKGAVEADNLPTIEADPSQMCSLFENLITNSLKFAQPDTPPLIRISTRELEGADRGAMVEISIADNGIGFDEKYLDIIFRPFQGLHGKKYEGIGIGLTICKRIITNHNGTIVAGSTPGKGSIFTVVIPVVHEDVSKLIEYP
jgi:signal transduction histidine kinase